MNTAPLRYDVPASTAVRGHRCSSSFGGVARSSEFRREIVPLLAKALQPLRPTQHEIDVALEELRTLKQKIGRKVSAPDLLEQIRDAA